MQKNIFLTATFVAVGLCTAQAQVPTQKELDQKRSDWERMQIIDPKTGDVPFDRLLSVYEQADKKIGHESMRISSSTTTSSISNCDNPNWIEIGPSSTTRRKCG
jgi:hypothetical protein